MALPPQAIERLSREPVRTPGWSGRLLMFSATLLILALVAYFGLEYGYRIFLEKELQKLESQENALAEQIPSDSRSQLLKFYSQLANLKKILSERNLASTLFAFLETNTHPRVFFTKFLFEGSRRQISLAGVGKSVTDVAEQIRIFRSQPEVSEVKINEVSLGGGGLWQFAGTITLTPAALQTDTSPETIQAAAEPEPDPAP